MVEIWKDVKGFGGLYQVSNFGNVKSLSKEVINSTLNNSKRIVTEKILKQRCRKDKKSNYYSVQLCKNGIKKPFQTHRLVALHFILNTDNKPCVNHLNGNKQDNRVDNLEWCTYSENQNHAINTGLFKDKYENNPMAKLSNIQVLEIKQMLKVGCKQRDIAKKFNVHFGTISDIKNNKTWKDLI